MFYILIFFIGIINTFELEDGCLSQPHNLEFCDMVNYPIEPFSNLTRRDDLVRGVYQGLNEILPKLHYNCQGYLKEYVCYYNYFQRCNENKLYKPCMSLCLDLKEFDCWSWNYRMNAKFCNATYFFSPEPHLCTRHIEHLTIMQNKV